MNICYAQNLVANEEKKIRLQQLEKTETMKISGVIITYNEEKNIERCLKSLTNIVDEIIVLDSFSTDKTEALCKKYNVRFFQHIFNGHIEQKNRVITHTQYDYILSLDADEVVSPELEKSILKIKKDWKYSGYYFNRLNNYCGKWIKYGGWYPDKKLRLWKKDEGQWGGINPHDEVILQKKAKTVHLKGDLLHYSYYSISGHILQANKFTDISSKILFDKGTKSNIFQILVKPFWKFIKDYVINLGFLDGYYGFVISMISAHATFLKYIKLKQLNDKNNA